MPTPDCRESNKGFVGGESMGKITGAHTYLPTYTYRFYACLHCHESHHTHILVVWSVPSAHAESGTSPHPKTRLCLVQMTVNYRYYRPWSMFAKQLIERERAWGQGYTCGRSAPLLEHWGTTCPLSGVDDR